jgi:hypothetical protein
MLAAKRLKTYFGLDIFNLWRGHQHVSREAAACQHTLSTVVAMIADD